MDEDDALINKQRLDDNNGEWWATADDDLAKRRSRFNIVSLTIE